MARDITSVGSCVWDLHSHFNSPICVPADRCKTVPVPAWQSRVASSPPHFAISSRYPPHQDPLALLGSSSARSEHGLRRWHLGQVRYRAVLIRRNAIRCHEQQRLLIDLEDLTDFTACDLLPSGGLRNVQLGQRLRRWRHVSNGSTDFVQLSLTVGLSA